MPEKLTLTPGIMIGAYRITEMIGKGGFSEVWSGWDTRLNRLVAIKIIPRVGTDAHNTIQFGREAAMVTRLEHPHVLPLYDFGEAPEIRYLVMRYVTGGSLAQRLERGALSISDIVQLMTPIAATLDYIHDQKVVHRDLKPGNILLDAQGLPYLTDFGLAKELTDETRPMHSASGTLTYMPPEQFSGGSMSTRSDQYSFGILLYQLFTGELPYEGKVALGMRQLANGELLTDVTLRNPKLPARLNEYLWKLTDPDPQKRPESASGIMTEIAGLLHGLEGGEPATPQGITYALESGAYRQREAETLIQQNLVGWLKDEFTLSVTHFVLLDILLRGLPMLITDDVRSMMLRGALEFNQQIDYWWTAASEAERQRACWHAVQKGGDPVCLKALSLAVSNPWASTASNEILNGVGKRLIPVSEFTPVALQFLERSLPTRNEWITDASRPETDDNLRTLAMSKSPLADRAAGLIGTARRTRAMMGLPKSFGQANPILVAYETARTLPPGYSTLDHIRLLIMLAFRQLTRQPLAALSQYGWAALGNCLAFGLIIYVVFRALDPTNIQSPSRMLATLGDGLLFGLIYAIGVWAARHIGQRLQIAPYWVRTLLGTLVGGLIVAWGFNLFAQLVYQDIIDPSVSISSGLLYVVGFALSVGLPLGLQLLLGAAGVSLAFLIPWANYVGNFDLRPPFVFPEPPDNDPRMAIPLVIVAALLMAVLTTGYLWRSRLSKMVGSRKQPPAPAGEIIPAAQGQGPAVL